jgi:hypothetical protein
MRGWECPKCGRVYAPGFPSCTHCGKETVTGDIDTLIQEARDLASVAIRDGEAWRDRRLPEMGHLANRLAAALEGLRDDLAAAENVIEAARQIPAVRFGTDDGYHARIRLKQELAAWDSRRQT